MALTQRPKEVDPEEEAKRIADFESQGAKRKRGDKREERAFTIRLPVDLICRIDEKRSTEVERMPRNTWIVMALDEATGRE